MAEAAQQAATPLTKAADDGALGCGADVVSMSYGSPQGDFPAPDTVQQYDAYFQDPGAAFVAAAGDSFNTPMWPAVSDDVLSVGGTQLSLGPDDTYGGEVAWHDVTLGNSTKGSGTGYGQFSTAADPTAHPEPDVSYAADGYAFYYDGAAQTEGWGTSFGAPQWAGLIALADARRATPLTSDAADDPSTDIQTGLGAAPAADFRGNSATGRTPASQGGNVQTGLGSPTGKLVEYLRGYAAPSFR